MACIFYCSICASRLGYLTPVFMQVCDYYFSFEVPVEIALEGIDAKQVRSLMRSIYNLESLGCVISTETGLELMSIKPIGFDVKPGDAWTQEKSCPIWCIDKSHVHERV